MPEIMIVRLATCPLRLLGPYGCEWINTPNLDRLAATGIVFDSHFVSGRIGQEYYAGKRIPFESFEPSAPITESVMVEWDPFADWIFEEIDLKADESRADFFGELKSVIEEWDNQLAPFLELSQHVPFALTAKTGLPIGEHGIFGIEQSRLHTELVHIPLIMVSPDRKNAGLRISGLTTPIVLAEMGISTFSEVQAVVTWDDHETALRTSDSCFIRPHDGEDRPALLFDSLDDRYEVNDLFVRQPDRIDELALMMTELRSKMPG